MPSSYPCHKYCMIIRFAITEQLVLTISNRIHQICCNLFHIDNFCIIFALLCSTFRNEFNAQVNVKFCLVIDFDRSNRFLRVEVSLSQIEYIGSYFLRSSAIRSYMLEVISFDLFSVNLSPFCLLDRTNTM